MKKITLLWSYPQWKKGGVECTVTPRKENVYISRLKHARMSVNFEQINFFVHKKIVFVYLCR